jgi:Co/Zn/Cd efflux system component
MINNSESNATASPPEKVWSNQTVLFVTAVGFLLFAIAEMIGALAGHSLSLLGDATATSVDVFTYFCNMYAENVKARYVSTGKYKYDRNTMLIMELYIPLFSVIALMGVSIYIASGMRKVSTIE